MTTNGQTHHAIGYIEIPVTDLAGARRFPFLDPDGHELAVWTERDDAH